MSSTLDGFCCRAKGFMGEVDDLGGGARIGGVLEFVLELVCVGTREVLFWIFWVLARGSLLFLQSQQQQISQIQDCSSMKRN